MIDKVLRIKTVLALTGLSRTTLYERIRDGRFPKQMSLGGRAVGWLESEVMAWMQLCADNRAAA